METGAITNAESIVLGRISPPMKVKLDHVLLQTVNMSNLVTY
jgi:hypothetical protein